MANVHVGARPKGRPDGDRIDVVEGYADPVLAATKTPREAIDGTRDAGHTLLVARIRS